MDAESLVSIIVPVYNAENHLEKCVDSILNQTYKNIEVILINDGSSDNSGVICQNLAKKDNRIKVVHQVNQGPSASRNTGIKYSNGKYIQFVDSDDCIDINMTYKLVSQMNENIHLTICGYKIIQKLKDEFKAIERIPQNSKVFSKNDFLKSFGKFYFERLINSPCNKLYNANIIKDYNVYFPENINMGEDLLFNLEYIKYCENISVINESLYIYQKHENNSLTSSYKTEFFNTQRFLFNKVKKFLIKLKVYDEENKEFLGRLYTYRIIDAFQNLYHDNSNLTVKEIESKIETIVNDKTVRDCIVYFKKGNIQLKILGFLIDKRAIALIYYFFKFKILLKSKSNHLIKLLTRNF